jgi:hypothetical protein
VILACNLVHDRAGAPRDERSENGPKFISREGDS